MSPSTEPSSSNTGPRWANPWVPVFGLAAVLAAVTITQSFQRYESFRTGWPWDLAYYNQWFWALVFGDQTITVNTFSAYAVEGPSIWHANYLALGRLLIVPIYWLVPGPKTLLVIEGIGFWLLIPASFSLVRSETRSNLIALTATFLVPFTPILWPLAWNDFRELQIGIPFVFWTIQGIRGRDRRLTTLGIIALLLCRQEFALMLATFAFIPPREPEDIGRTYRWTHGLLFLGVAWFLFAFFGYLSWFVGPRSPTQYIAQFGDSPLTWSQKLETMSETLILSLGAWAVFTALVPRLRWITFLWLYSISGGRWAMWVLATWSWHHVRYTVPFVAVGLAAGLIGFGHVSQRVLRARDGRYWFGVMVVWIAALSSLALRNDLQMMADQAPLMSDAEAQEVWKWIRQVKPDDGVLSCYLTSAPLSTRRHLYSYVLPINRPRGYPRLAPDIRWVFFRPRDRWPLEFTNQGFTTVFEGQEILVLRRDSDANSEISQENRKIARTSP